MSQEDSSSQITSSGRLIRWLVGGLPWGLVLMGALSFVFYFNKKNKPEAQPSQFASVLRRELNENDFQRYLRILGREIGERSQREPGNREAAASFMESTLGPDNMGHGVLREEFSADGQPLANIIAPLTGKSKPGEAIVVLAAHDSTSANAPDESAGAAALLCVAHSMSGDPQERTVVFLSVSNALAARDDANGCWQAAQHQTLRDLTITRIIALNPGKVEDAFRFPENWKAIPTTHRDVHASMPLAELQSVAAEIRTAAR